MGFSGEGDMSKANALEALNQYDPEDLIATMRETPHSEAMEMVLAMPISARARMAVFFYQRRHLRSIGLEIARSCPRGALLEAAGGAGETIFTQSRDPAQTLAAGQFADERTSRVKQITLAGSQH